MSDSYDPGKIEAWAQTRWREARAFEAHESDPRPPFYVLSMFPYPSGRLHMGHVRNYTIGDVIARYHRMRGESVLQPMGFDAFGLPAENAAIQNQTSPARWTETNIATMKGQLDRLGFGYDWRREIVTCRPGYYRFEQWLFTELYRMGLAYREKASVNWDPVDQTVLANEQVIDGCGWRSGAPVERREIEQWFVRITAYAEELLNGLDTLTGWPEEVKRMQRNWIGRSSGVEIDFERLDGEGMIRVFTTRADTLYGVTYLALAPEHPIVQDLARHHAEMRAFVQSMRQRETREAALETQEKRGLPTGIRVRHPLTGEALPVWVASFVVMTYGTGAIMAVPAHDARDHEFAKRYGLPIRSVVRVPGGEAGDVTDTALTDEGIVVDSGPLTGLSSQAARIRAHDLLGERAREVVHYRLRDWGVSRQRYWGCPIPMVHCPECGIVPVPARELPVVLPETVQFSGVRSPLITLASFRETPCPHCGKPAFRETDTFDTFFESSWYYARFASYNCAEAILDDRAHHWLPVNQYIGGIEHAVLHLLYARFFHKVLRDMGWLRCNEPFARLLSQGMVLKDGAKMSKSKGNVVDPEAIVARFGADTARLFMMFAAPPEQSLEWSEQGVEGAQRFIKRLWRQVHERAGDRAEGVLDPGALSDPGTALWHFLHETVAGVEVDIGIRQTFNTAIAKVMEFMNALARFEPVGQADRVLVREATVTIVHLLHPIIPHVTESLWQTLGGEGLLAMRPWPVADPVALARSEIELVIQVNGRRRGSIRVRPDEEEYGIRSRVLADPALARFIDAAVVERWVFVPGRLMNVVMRGERKSG
ncbi:MAG: leucine--tRNA ligase [Gammaproteobacteria bacterium]